MADFDGLLDQVPDKLHELVDAVVVDKVPLLPQVLQQGPQEDIGILLGHLGQHGGDLGGQVVLVDHLVEVPQPEEQGLDDVGH